MHTDVYYRVGTLTDLFSDYIVIEWSLCRKYYNFLRRCCWLGRGNNGFFLFIHWNDIHADTWDTSRGVPGRGLFRSRHDVSHSVYGLWTWKHSIVLLIIMVPRLSSLNYGSFYIAISSRGTFKTWICIGGSCCRCSLSSLLIFGRARLEKEVINYHLGLVHVYWWRHCCRLSPRPSLIKHISLLFLQELHVVSLRRYNVIKSIYDRLGLIKLLFSFACSCFHGSPVWVARILICFIWQSRLISTKLRLSGLLLLRLRWGCRSRGTQEGLRLLVLLDSDGHGQVVSIVTRSGTRGGHDSTAIWWKGLSGTESGRRKGDRSARLFVQIVDVACSIGCRCATTWGSETWIKGRILGINHKLKRKLKWDEETYVVGLGGVTIRVARWHRFLCVHPSSWDSPCPLSSQIASTSIPLYLKDIFSVKLTLFDNGTPFCTVLLVNPAPV